MIRRTHRRPGSHRRGAILLVVIGMLALFAVIGLSFVLYAESEATGARNNRAARNELTDPDPVAVANAFVGQFVFGTADQSSALFAHDLAISRFGPVGAQSPFIGTGIPPETDAMGTVIPVRGAVGGVGLAGLDRTGSTLVTPISMDRRQAINFRLAPGWDQVSPFLANVGQPNQIGINKAVPFTYPDRNNFYLAYYDPVTDQITVPSFHRPDLFLNTNTAYTTPAQQIAASLSPDNPKWRNTDPANPAFGDSSGFYQTLRPRQAEHPNFPTVPMNADGSFTGDVANLKWLFAGTSPNQFQKNDSLWMDLNLPVKEWRGKRYKPLVAPLILDLSGRVNLAVAGNQRGFPLTPTPPNMNPVPTHASHHGWGGWEVNPSQLLGLANPNPPAMPLAEQQANALLALTNLRYTGANPSVASPTPLDRFRGLSTGTLNRNARGFGQMTPQYTRIDAGGPGTGAADPMLLPTAGGFLPFPNYNTGAGGVSRFAQSQSNVMAAPTLDSQLSVNPGGFHPQSFSPYQWPRQGSPTANTPWVPGLEDQMRLLLRTGGPKGPSGYSGQFTLNPKLTTLFSVSQRWGEITVRTNNAGGAAKLAAIDLTRPLPDYRLNLNGPVSPQNIGNLINARVARQNLARDIFVRLAAVMNQIDGTRAAYDPTTGYLRSFDPMAVAYGPITDPATIASLRFWAQYAVNMVDQIDSDDVSTTFVWNPIAPSQFDVNDTLTGGPANPNLLNFDPTQIANRVVFGTELPKLVLNEAFNALDNDRADKPPAPVPPLMMKPAKKNARKLYWIELHNPLATDPALPEGGAARLQYDPAITQVFDATTNAVAPYTATATPNPVYQIEIAEVQAGGMPGVPQQPYTAFLGINPLGAVANYVTTPVPGMTHKIVLNNYTAWNAAGSPDMKMQLPPNDAQNVVLPANGGPGGQGYFLIGPRDQFPAPAMAPVVNTLNVTDPPNPLPAGPVNSLIYDAGVPSGANLTTQVGTSSVILLRRLVNPYLPAQPDPTVQTTPYNPYMTVDYLENVPVRDRAEYDDKDKRGTGLPFPTSNLPSIGRRHPYAAAPCYNPTQAGMGAAPFPAVVDQAPPAGGPAPTNPPHTFGAANNQGATPNPANLDNNRPNPIAGQPPLGLEWLAHLDREPVNQLELLMTSIQSPALLTQRFYDGSLYQKHVGAQAAGIPVTPLPLDPVNFPNAHRAYDLLGVANRLPGIPLGGREPGRININGPMDATVTAGAPDAAILQAVFDPQSGNLFTQVPGYIPNAWGTGLLPSRTPNTTANGGINNLPAGTVAETGVLTGDRPFNPTGALQDTLFRQGAVANSPALFNFGVGTNGHPYMFSEPLRKGWNNLTTVSDGFLVAFTVGFFEVNGSNQLGKEIFDKVPGDLRAQYAGIVDRSALTIDVPPANAPTQLNFGPKPWETKLIADASVGSSSITIQAQCTAADSCVVFDEGTPVTITAGRSVLPMPPGGPATADVGPLLYIGYAGIGAGGDGEWVRVDTITPGPTLGTATLTLNTTPSVNPALPAYSPGLLRFHGGGSRVSNAQLGHPGPQPAFDYRDTTGRYRGVLPYFMRVVP